MPEIFYPPKAVQNACKRGLYMFEQGMGGDGLAVSYTHLTLPTNREV